MTKLLSIIENTFIQTVRQGIFSVLLLVMFAVLVLALPLTNWAMATDYHDSNQKMLEGIGLSTLLVMGLFAAAFSASGAVGREIEDKTALTVISKPVSRAKFVFGKFVGVAGAVTLFFYLGAIVYLWTVRHRVMPAASDQIDWPIILMGCGSVLIAILIATAGNLLFEWTFTSTVVFSATITMTIAMGVIAFIGKGWEIVEFGQGIRPQLLIALLMLLMALMVFVSVAVAASTRFGQVMTLLICAAVFFIGSMHPFLFGYWNDRLVLAQPIGWISPILVYFYPLDALVQDKDIPPHVLGMTAAYCTLYVSGILALGMALFQKRQLESQGSSASMPGAVGLLAWTGRIVAIVLGVIGLESAAAYIASRMSPTFQPVAVDGLKFVFFSSESADALTLIPAIGMIVAAIAFWMLWGYFGRGVRWSRIAVQALAILALLRAVLVGFGVDAVRIGVTDKPVPLAAQIILSLAVLAILYLPKTKRHFVTSSH